MQGIYTYIPETNHDRKEHNFAAILSQLFMVPTSLSSALAIIIIIIIIIIGVIHDVVQILTWRSASSIYYQVSQ
jgi:membrane protein YdbS with pleckstrin-like domain